jgi:predicted CoA-binding protein
MTSGKPVKSIYTRYRRIAVYGMSTDPGRASHKVAAFLQSKGYDILPVNPRADSIMDRKSYPDLMSIPGAVEIVDVFRPPDQALEVVNEAIARKRERGDIAVVWLQLGIRNDKARKLAESAGLNFIQDRCMMREFKRIFEAKE